MLRDLTNPINEMKIASPTLSCEFAVLVRFLYSVLKSEHSASSEDRVVNEYKLLTLSQGFKRATLSRCGKAFELCNLVKNLR